MKVNGLNNTSLKQRNRGLILKLIATDEASSRIELTRKTGLSKMGISNIVNELINDGIIEEKEKVQVDGQGRNPVQLCISDKAPKLIGVHIYRERCSIILCDIQLKVLKKIEFPLNEQNISKLIPEIEKGVSNILSEFSHEKIFGIGIGAIGPVNNNQGRILTPPNFYGIHDLNIRDEIRKKYDMPVYFEGESNCAAMAEKYYGSGKNCEDFIYIDLANGIGTGVIANGKLYTNTSGLVCELGHTSINWQGNICGCGNKGCIETYVSSNVLQRQMQELTGEKKSFYEFCREMDNAFIRKKETGAEFGESEKAIDTIFVDMVQKLTCAITSFVNGLNPQKIIIGHEGYWIPDIYLEMLERQVNAMHIAKNYRKIQIVKSYYESEATTAGCACSLLTAIFEGKLF